MTALRSRPVGLALFLLILAGCVALLMRGVAVGLPSGSAYAGFKQVDERMLVVIASLAVFVLAGIADYFKLTPYRRTMRTIIVISVIVAVTFLALAMVHAWYYPTPVVH